MAFECCLSFQSLCRAEPDSCRLYASHTLEDARGTRRGRAHANRSASIGNLYWIGTIQSAQVINPRTLQRDEVQEKWHQYPFLLTPSMSFLILIVWISAPHAQLVCANLAHGSCGTRPSRWSVMRVVHRCQLNLEMQILDAVISNRYRRVFIGSLKRISWWTE